MHTANFTNGVLSSTLYQQKKFKVLMGDYHWWKPRCLLPLYIRNLMIKVIYDSARGNAIPVTPSKRNAAYWSGHNCSNHLQPIVQIPVDGTGEASS